jgi:hypothetical protein
MGLITLLVTLTAYVMSVVLSLPHYASYRVCCDLGNHPCGDPLDALPVTYGDVLAAIPSWLELVDDACMFALGVAFWMGVKDS